MARGVRESHAAEMFKRMISGARTPPTDPPAEEPKESGSRTGRGRGWRRGNAEATEAMAQAAAQAAVDGEILEHEQVIQTTLDALLLLDPFTQPRSQAESLMDTIIRAQDAQRELGLKITKANDARELKPGLLAAWDERKEKGSWEEAQEASSTPRAAPKQPRRRERAHGRTQKGGDGEDAAERTGRESNRRTARLKNIR